MDSIFLSSKWNTAFEEHLISLLSCFYSKIESTIFLKISFSNIEIICFQIIKKSYLSLEVEFSGRFVLSIYMTLFWIPKKREKNEASFIIFTELGLWSHLVVYLIFILWDCTLFFNQRSQMVLWSVWEITHYILDE